jgi:hypothetical protein
VSKRWPRPPGALAGCLFLVLFVIVPELRHANWRFEILRYLMVPMLVAGVIGAVVGWLLVTVRNRLMIQR